MTPALDDAAGFADRLAAAAARGGRVVAALAGAPGSGKSTLAAAVAARLNADAPGACVVVPMDGYHLDDSVLAARGWLPRKGAPHTFDVGGLAAMLGRLRDATEEEVFFPLFDRGLEIARAGAGVAPREARVILVEGNWLLLDAPPWSGLRTGFDIAAFVDCPPAILAARLRARWRAAGLPAAEVERRLADNDLPNALLAMSRSIAPDVLVDGS